MVVELARPPLKILTSVDRYEDVGVVTVLDLVVAQLPDNRRRLLFANQALTSDTLAEHPIWPLSIALAIDSDPYTARKVEFAVIASA